MRRFLIVSHGQLAEGMANTIAMIAGTTQPVEAKGLFPGEQPEQMLAWVVAKLEAHPQDEFVVFTDLFGGSVNNCLASLCLNPNVHVVAGMNLALVMSICLSSDGEPTDQLVRTSVDTAKTNIVYGNDKLKERCKKGGDDFFD